MFTTDWFSRNIGNWTEILGHLKGLPIEALEIGCWEGRATLWLLENILTNRDSYITVVDTFQGGIDNNRVDIVHPEELRKNFEENTEKYKNRILIKEGLSNLKIPHLIDDWFSLAYIDGSHQAPDVLMDALNVWPKVKQGGIIVFDDYLWNEYPNDPLLNPRPGIDAFLDFYDGKFELLQGGYQLFIKKL